MTLCMCTFALSAQRRREGWVSRKHFVLCWQCPHEGLHLHTSPAVCECLAPYSLGLHTVLHLCFSPNWEVMLFQYCFNVLFFNHGWAGTYFMFKGHFMSLHEFLCVWEREHCLSIHIFSQFFYTVFGPLSLTSLILYIVLYKINSLILCLWYVQQIFLPVFDLMVFLAQQFL